MTESMTRPDADKTSATGGTDLKTRRSGEARPARESAPQNRGHTTIADGVVEQIAGMAAREVPGLHSLGSGMTRALGAMRDVVPGSGTDVTRGIKVEVGEQQAAVDVDVVVDYGVVIPEVAADVRKHVISEVERMTGFEVVEVNIEVDDVYLPDLAEDEPDEGRVR